MLSAGRARAAATSLACVFLAVLPFSSSVALRNVAMALAGIAGITWLVKRSGDWRCAFPAARILLPIACWTSWCLLSLAWSVDPSYSLTELRPGLLPTLGAFLLFYGLTLDFADLDRWAWSLAAGLAVLALAAIAQHLLLGRWDPTRWHVDGGYYATHVVLAAPMLVWLWLRQAARAAWVRPALLATALATMIATYWADNRIVWIALAVMTIAAAAMSARGGGAAARRRAVVVTLVTVAFAAGLFALAHQQRNEILHSRGGEGAQLVTDPRLAIWPFALERIAEKPLIGHGYGRGILRDTMRTAGAAPDNPLHWHAHDLFLNVALQVGLVGLALFLWMWGAMARELVGLMRAAPPRRWLAILGFALLAGYTVKNVTDDFHVRHIALLAYSLAGALIALARAPRSTGRP